MDEKGIGFLFRSCSLSSHESEKGDDDNEIKNGCIDYGSHHSDIALCRYSSCVDHACRNTPDGVCGVSSFFRFRNDLLHQSLERREAEAFSELKESGILVDKLRKGDTTLWLFTKTE